MKYILVFIIKVYWALVPKEKRKKCIYRHSCSQYVYAQAMNGGLIKGIKALLFRMQTCNGYSFLYQNPITMETEMMVSNNHIIPEKEIALRLMEELHYE